MHQPVPTSLGSCDGSLGPGSRCAWPGWRRRGRRRCTTVSTLLSS